MADTCPTCNGTGKKPKLSPERIAAISDAIDYFTEHPYDLDPELRRRLREALVRQGAPVMAGGPPADEPDDLQERA